LFGLLAMVLLMPAIAAAQQNGSIGGVVTDSTGGVLPGVTVEAASPELIEKVRTTTTDGNGRYQIVDLRPGVYTVTFTLQGFSVVRREGITLTAGFAAPVNTELNAGAIEETITVSAASPVVDVKNVAVSRVMTREVLDIVPTARVIGSLMTLVPGVSITTAGGPNVDTGGAAGYTYANAMIHGSKQGDQIVGTNGIAMVLIQCLGCSRINLPDGSVQEYEMKYSSHPAEYAYGGFTVNAIPKQGGNRFTGSLFITGTGTAFHADNLDDKLRAQGLTVAGKVKHLLDFNPVFGGPIVRDKVWFFGGLRYQNTDSYIGGMYYAKDATAWVYEPDLTRPANGDQLSYDYNTNLTWQISQKNKVNVLLMRNVTHWYHASVTGTVTPEAGQDWLAPGTVALGTWTSPLTSRLLLDVTTARYAHDFDREPTKEARAVQLVDQGTGITSRGLATSSFTGQVVYTTRAALSYITGAHNIKGGFDYAAQIQPPGLTFSMPGSRANPHAGLDVSYRALNGIPNQVTYYTTPWSNPLWMHPAGLYVQDQTTLRKWTINAGLRFDRFTSGYPEIHLDPSTYVPYRRDYPAANVLNWKDLSPRLAVSFDLFGNGKTAIKAAASKFVLQESSTTATNLVVPTSATVNSVNRTWTDSNRDFVVQGDPFNIAANGELGPSTNVNFGKQITTFRLDPDWANGFGKRRYSWEFMSAVQHEVASNISAEVAYYRRVFGNFIVTDNLLTAPSDFDPFCITGPLDSRLPGGGGARICGLYDLNPGKVGLVDTVQRSSSYYGKQQDHYDGVDVTMNGRLPSGGVLQGGLSTGKYMTDNCDIVTKIDNPSTYQCHKESKWVPQVKLIGSYPLPWSFHVSGTFQTQILDTISNGQSNMGFIANYVATNAQVSPSLGRNLSTGTNVTVNVLEPATQYNQRSNQFDLRFTRRFQVRGARLQANFDIYNLLNANFVSTRNGTYGTNGALWLQPGAILPARLLKFSGQLNF
jgi:hypothetical protein